MKKTGILSLVFFMLIASTQVVSAVETDEQSIDKQPLTEEKANENQNQEGTEESKGTDVTVDTATNEGNVTATTNEEIQVGEGTNEVETKKVAKIGVTEYETLADAIAAATGGDTITLLADAEVASHIDILKNLTIDGANTDADGKNFTVNAAYEGTSGDQSIFTVANNSTLTIKNATLSNSPKYGVQAYSGGTVDLSNVTFTNNAFGAVLVNGGKLEISGAISINAGKNGVGIELAKGTGVATEPTIQIGAEITMTSSHDLSKVIYIDRNQVTEVNEETITAIPESKITVEFDEKIGFNIKNGDDQIAAPSFPQGNILVLVDGIVEKAFDSLDKAILGANVVGSTLKLENDIQVAGPILIEKDLTLDGNKKTITATYTDKTGNQTILTTSANVTIKDVTLKDSPKYGIQVYGSKSNTKIENVTFDNNAYGAILVNGGTAEVNNVKFGESQITGIELGRGSAITTPSNLKITGKIEAEKPEKAIYIDLGQVISHEQSTITSNFYDVSTDSVGKITLKKDGQVAFETAGNVKPVAPNVPTQPSTWDDGGPFTTDSCGNIFDRWGNEMYKAPTCKVTSGYKVPNTGVR